MYIEDSAFKLSASDLSNHLSCEHLTELNRKVALKELDKPQWTDPSLAVLEQRGRDHEKAYVQFLGKKGLKIVDATDKDAAYTLDAMKAGADVIVQGYFQQGNLHGRADILLKVTGKSKLGDWSFEIQDTKLAQQTRASTVLQLCFYSDLLGNVLGHDPEYFYVVKPGDNFPTERFGYADFRAYYRMTKQNFERRIAEGKRQTYPEPVEHCSICRWWQICDKRRHEDDHLSLVAGIRNSQIEELKEQKLDTLEQFAKAKKLLRPRRGNQESLLRKQAQAKIQLKGRIAKQLLYESLRVEPSVGLNRLPKPDAGDVYFDIEGDIFYEDGGLEYLLGYAFVEKGQLIYKSLWSTTRKEEKEAFIQFMDFIKARWQAFPGMHIYHFAPYEQTALKRLATVHASHEKELDKLLRAERLIDLHAIFKESALASVETYSLKALEQLTTYQRKVELHDASVARKATEVALELGEFKTLPKETLENVEVYNQDDCLATEELHRWMEGLRESLRKSGSQFERPELKTGEAPENVQQHETRAQALFSSLTKGLPEDKAEWTDEHKAKWLLANQIDYFRREDKSAWWEFFRVHELDHEDLLEERKAISGLEFVEILPKQGKERNETHRYRFPEQEISMDEGEDVIQVRGEKVGSIKAISLENLTIDIKKTSSAKDIHPAAIHVSERVDPGALATALMDFAESVDEYGLGHVWPFHAAKDLLMRRPPALLKPVSLKPAADQLKQALEIAQALDRSVLAIQGPPGSGKTYTGAHLIMALVASGKKVGITAVSHKVIRNLALSTLKEAKKAGQKISFVHKVKEKEPDVPDEIIESDDADDVREGLNHGRIGCGTAWLWADDKSKETLDYLFVDEAGQMSLAQVLAASLSAKNLVLLGDPQQLEQPQRGAHPEGSDVAGLTYLLDGHATMPEGNGLFLEQTRRLHPDICAFTSEIFYENRLKPYPGHEQQRISGTGTFDGSGLRFVPVEHRGCASRSGEEVEVIARIVGKLLKGGQWTDNRGKTHPLEPNDILIVAPYNAQVAALSQRLPNMRIGTVDKFQGQEAPVVIYSMTASTVPDAPRGMNFLFNPNRLNVATSRARCLCILVASPKLLETDCNTIDQMRWANGLCSFIELVNVGQR